MSNGPKPMGPSGVDTNIITGRPLETAPEVEASKVKSNLEKATLMSWQITAELHQNSQMIRILMEKYRDRLLILGESDEVLKALDEAIMAIRTPLEFKPAIAEKVARFKLGSRLAAFLE